MLEAAIVGLIGASSLLVGAGVSFAFKLSRVLVGLIMAFGVGTLIASLSFELVVPAMESAEVWQVGVALSVGSLTFFIGDMLIGRIGGKKRKSPDGDEEGGSGLGIVLGTVLDGIPESATLGMSLASGGGVSVALLAAIWISNFPESLGSSVNLTKSGMSRGKILLMWLGIVLVSALSSAIGYVIIVNSSTLTGAFVSAFAAGALLTMIADEMAPEAFGRSSLYTGLATTAGFILAVFLTSLG